MSACRLPAVTLLCSDSQHVVSVCLLSRFPFPSRCFWPLGAFWLHSVCFSSASSFLLLSCSPFSCLLFLTLLSPHPSSSPSPCLPLVATGEQLALLQYRLSMSSMPCQPHAPPGSGTLHTYQVLLPFHSPPPLWGLLEVNHSHYRSQSRPLLCYWPALCHTPLPSPN